MDLIVPLMDFLSLHVFSNSAVAALSSVYLASFLSAPTLTELVVLQQSFRILAKNQSRRLITKNMERRAGFLLLHNVFRAVLYSAVCLNGSVVASVFPSTSFLFHFRCSLSVHMVTANPAVPSTSGLWRGVTTIQLESWTTVNENTHTHRVMYCICPGRRRVGAKTSSSTLLSLLPRGSRPASFKATASCLSLA